MANDTYAKLIIDFQAKVDNMERNTARAASSLDKVHGSASKLAGMLASGLLAGGIAGTVTALGRLAKGAIDAGGAIADGSRRLSISAMEYQTIALAAQLAGTDIETVTKMIETSRKKVAEASRDASKAEIFNRVGLDAEKLLAMPITEYLDAIATALSGIENPALATEAAMSILGKAGPKTAILLKEYTAAMKEAAEVTKNGINDDDAARLDKLGESYEKAIKRLNQFKMHYVLLWQDLYDSLPSAKDINPLADTNMIGDWSPVKGGADPFGVGRGKDPFGIDILEASLKKRESVFETLAEQGAKMRGLTKSDQGLLEMLDAEFKKRPEYKWLTDKEKSKGAYDEENAEDAKKIIEDTVSASQKYAEAVSRVIELEEKKLISSTQSKAKQAELRAEFEKDNPVLAAAAKHAEEYANKLEAMSKKLDAVAESARNVPEKVSSGILAEAGAALGKEAWTTIQGENLYKSTDAARNFRTEMGLLEKAFKDGRVSWSLFVQAVGAGWQQYSSGKMQENIAGFEQMVSSMKSSNASELIQFTVSLQEMTQMPVEKFASEMEKLNDALAKGAINWDLYARGVFLANKELFEASGMSDLQEFAQGEFKDTRNPFEEYAAHMEKLNMADMFGMIDPDTYMRSAMMAASEMDRALGLDKLPQMGSPFIAPPAAPGTAGFSTASQIAGVLAGAMAPADTAKKQLTEAQKTTALLERIASGDGRIYL